MECRITTLCENNAGMGLLGEWGFSALVETPETTILFDTGGGKSLKYNAGVLDIDLKKVDRIVLSHNHYDHTGGLAVALECIGRETEVVAAPELWQQEKYAYKKTTDSYHYIDIPFVRPHLESLGGRFTLTRQPAQLGENIMTTGEVAISSDFETVGEDDLMVKTDQGYSRDDFSDSRSLIINTSLGLVVLTGCGHRAPINILHHAQALFNGQRIYALLGGIHLMKANDERIERTIQALVGLGVQMVGTSHCTGRKTEVALANAFGESFFFNNAGACFTVPPA